MEEYWLERTERILGEAAIRRLQASRIAVFGLGGVGGHAAEALARSGVGTLDLIDKDMVDITNLNRQLVALHSSLGLQKTEVLKQRLLDINPDLNVITHDLFYLPETADRINLRETDLIVDAIDNVTAKVYLVKQAKELGIPIISCLGTGNRLDPSQLMVTDIADTTGDPLAKAVRTGLRKQGIEHLPVVFSKEPPLKTQSSQDAWSAEPVGQPEGVRLQHSPGSTAFVPAAAGLLLASWAVRSLMEEKRSNLKRSENDIETRTKS